ncbi:MAG: AAA family ATPase [Candidatus Diapherotrites archaeon]
MIRRLVLKNWKTHYDTTLEFVKGTNVIVGKIGSGKSSVLDAVSYALYGTFPALNSRKVSLDEVIMVRPSIQNSALVGLEFVYAGKNYLVRRILRRNGVNEAELRENGNLISGPKTSDVNRKIEELLEVSYDLFSRAIYSEQNQLDAFLKMTPSQRKEKLDELLGLDKYELVRSNAVTLSSRFRKLSDDKRKFAEEQKKKIDFNKFEEYKKKVVEKQSEILSLEKSLVDLDNIVREKKENLDFLVDLEKKHVELEKRLTSLSSKISSLRDDCVFIEKKISGLSFDELSKKKAELGKKIEFLVAERSAIKKEQDTLRSLLVSLKEDKASLKADLVRLEKSISSIDSISGSCPVCKRPMLEHEKSFLLKEFLEEKKRVESLISEKDSLLKSHEASIDNIVSKDKSLENDLEVFKKQFFEIDSLLSSASELEKKKISLESYEKEFSSLSSELNSLGFDSERLRLARAEFSNYSSDLEKTKVMLKSSKELLDEINRSISIFENSLKNVSLLEDEANSLSYYSELVSIFVNALASAQVELRELMIDNINVAMSEIWPKIYPYGDIQGVKLVLVDGNYEIFAKGLNDELVRVEGILSGGERSCVAITLRIALSLVLTSNLGWIMLDEPTHNLDSSVVSRFAVTIGERLPELIGQVFIITHDKSLEVAGTGKLYHFEREKESQGYTKVF